MVRLRVPLLPAAVRWALVVVLAGVIFYLSVLTVPPGEPVVPKPQLLPLDKWRHFLAYGALANGLAYATAGWDRPTRQHVAIVVGATVLYGLGIEGAQALTPYRYFSLFDAYANALGALFVVPWFLLRERVAFVPFPKND